MQLREHMAGRAGMLTVELDGQRVLAVPVSIMNAVHADGVETCLRADARDQRQSIEGDLVRVHTMLHIASR